MAGRISEEIRNRCYNEAIDDTLTLGGIQVGELVKLRRDAARYHYLIKNQTTEMEILLCTSTPEEISMGIDAAMQEPKP